MIKADDDHGNTDTVTVEILAEVPEATQTATPTATPAPTPKPTAEPTPTEPPGFEAVFANFFTSQKPLLKMLRHCRSVSNRILSAEEEKGVRAKGKTKKCKILVFFYPLFTLSF